MLVYCQNCSWTDDSSKGRPVQRFHERVSPGEVVPYCECPKCGALCHDAQAGAKTTGPELLDALKDALVELRAITEYGKKVFGDEWWPAGNKQYQRAVIKLVHKDSYDDVIARAQLHEELP